MSVFTRVLLVFLAFALSASAAMAEEPAAPPPIACAAADRECILNAIENTAAAITEKSWRDQTYRELAKTLAFDGQTDRAMSLITRIESPDTRAMTIRGIGMAVADNKLSPEQYADIFRKLRAEAERIDHPPSYGIALTYIAMAQAFAGDDAGAMETAKSMENASLRNKAFGESAEIQAERGDFKAALASISLIDDAHFRDKAYDTVSGIFSQRGLYDDALAMAMKIGSPYMKSGALQYVLDRQKPREVPHGYEQNEKEVRP